MSEAMLKEAEDVLNRPKVRKKFKLSDAVVQERIQRLSRGECLEVGEDLAVSRDPKDDIFLACADVGQADYIVSEDNDLLVLNPYKTIQVIDMLDFIKVIRPPSSAP